MCHIPYQPYQPYQPYVDLTGEELLGKVNQKRGAKNKSRFGSRERVIPVEVAGNGGTNTIRETPTCHRRLGTSVGKGFRALHR